MNSEDRIISLLKKRHALYANVSEEKASRDPFWNMTTPLSKKDYQEWIEFGVNTVMSEMNITREKAEMEMSWIEGKYRIKVV